MAPRAATSRWTPANNSLRTIAGAQAGVTLAAFPLPGESVELPCMAIALQPVSDEKALAPMSATHAAASLVARAMLAAIFLASGVPKLFAYQAAAQYLATLGVPAQGLPLIIAVEIGGGLMILLGLFARWAALALALLAVATALVFHRNFADDSQMIEFLKNIGLAGGLLLLAANGPGRWSLTR